MAFPTTGILDDFNRANENPLSNGGKYNLIAANTALQVVSNQCTGTGASVNAARYNVSSFGPDSEAYMTVTTVPGTSYVRLWLRFTNPGASETGYMMQWSNDANGCRLFKMTSQDTYAQIAQNAAATYVNNDVIGFEAIGSQLTAYKNGTSVVTVADGTYATAGNIGIGINGTTGIVDNFGGGTRVASDTGGLAADAASLLAMGVL